MSDDIIKAGRFFRVEGRQSRRRKDQSGYVFKSGKKNPVTKARYYEPVLRDGKFTRVHRSVVRGPASMRERQAQTELQDLLRPMNEGLQHPLCGMPFDDGWLRWQAEIAPSIPSDTTRRFYLRTAQAYIVPYFTGWPRRDLTPLAAQQLVNKFKTYSGSLIRHVRSTLSRLLRAAKPWGWIQVNVAFDLELPPGKPVERAVVLRPRETMPVLSNLETPGREMLTIHCFFGLRESETLALEWGDFQRAHRVLWVERKVHRGVVGPPKRKASERDLPYGHLVASALARLEAAGYQAKDRLFLPPEGRYSWPEKIVQKAFNPVAERLGVPHFTFRSFRRSFQTTLKMLKVQPEMRSALMGQDSPERLAVLDDASWFTWEETAQKPEVTARWKKTLTGSLRAEGPTFSDPYGPKTDEKSRGFLM